MRIKYSSRKQKQIYNNIAYGCFFSGFGQRSVAYMNGWVHSVVGNRNCTSHKMIACINGDIITKSTIKYNQCE